MISPYISVIITGWSFFFATINAPIKMLSEKMNSNFGMTWIHLKVPSEQSLKSTSKFSCRFKVTFIHALARPVDVLQNKGIVMALQNFRR